MKKEEIINITEHQKRRSMLGLQSKFFCFDKTNIQFYDYFKPIKEGQFFQVVMFHKFLSSN